MKRGKGYYSISVVAKMFSVHQQTIRMYEKEGLISPKRTDGNTRLFSEEDVTRLEEIINLTHKMGVNLAGVEIILKLQKKMLKMHQEMNKLFKQMDGEITQHKEELTADLSQQVSRLASIKKERVGSQGNPSVLDAVDLEAELIEPKKRSVKGSGLKKAAHKEGEENWEIDYDNE